MRAIVTVSGRPATLRICHLGVGLAFGAIAYIGELLGLIGPDRTDPGRFAASQSTPDKVCLSTFFFTSDSARPATRSLIAPGRVTRTDHRWLVP
jgi:hypothetical protein